MNGKTSKRIHKKTKSLLVEWVRSLLSEEEAEKVSLGNIQHLLPTEQYFFANNRIHLNAYSFKWIKKGIKRVIKQQPEIAIENVTMEKIQCSLHLPKMRQNTTYKIL